MKPREDTGRVILVALVFFGTLAALGAIFGVYERLSGPTRVALAVFAGGFAIATYLLDSNVRAFVEDWRRAGRSPRPSPRAEGELRKAAAKPPGESPAAT